MKIYRILRNGLASACLLIFTSCLSLPSIIDMPDESFNPADNESLVFGRVEIIGNGVKIKPVIKHYFIKDSMNRGAPIYLVVYRLIEKPSNILEIEKSYHILVFREDGYFSAALPPGKYGICSVRINMKKSGFNLLTTSYQRHIRYDNSKDIPGNYKKFRDGSKIIFDVLPKKDVYIGTVRVIASAQMVEEEKIRFKALYSVTGDTSYVVPNLRPGVEMYDEVVSKLVTDELQVEDEFQLAKGVFLSLYPNLLVPLKRIGHVSNERWYAKRGIFYVDELK